MPACYPTATPSRRVCTDYNKPYDEGVIMAYKQYAMAAGYAARGY